MHHEPVESLQALLAEFALLQAHETTDLRSKDFIMPRRLGSKAISPGFRRNRARDCSYYGQTPAWIPYVSPTRQSGSSMRSKIFAGS